MSKESLLESLSSSLRQGLDSMSISQSEFTGLWNIRIGLGCYREKGFPSGQVSFLKSFAETCVYQGALGTSLETERILFSQIYLTTKPLHEEHLRGHK